MSTFLKFENARPSKIPSGKLKNGKNKNENENKIIIIICHISLCRLKMLFKNGSRPDVMNLSFTASLSLR